jgi:hypothetical protein
MKRPMRLDLVDYISALVLAAVIAITIRGCIEATESTQEVYTDVSAYR